MGRALTRSLARVPEDPELHLLEGSQLLILLLGVLTIGHLAGMELCLREDATGPGALLVTAQSAGATMRGLSASPGTDTGHLTGFQWVS